MKNAFCFILFCIVSLSATACANAVATPPAMTATPFTPPNTVITPAPAAPVQLQVVPKKLRPGMRATMLGQGFEGGETVAFYFIRPDGTKTEEGESTADKSGGAAFELDVMDDWKPGQYVARVQSKKNPMRRAEQKIELILR